MQKVLQAQTGAPGNHRSEQKIREMIRIRSRGRKNTGHQERLEHGVGCGGREDEYGFSSRTSERNERCEYQEEGRRCTLEGNGDKECTRNAQKLNCV